MKPRSFPLNELEAKFLCSVSISDNSPLLRAPRMWLGTCDHISPVAAKSFVNSFLEVHMNVSLVLMMIQISFERILGRKEPVKYLLYAH